MAPGQANRYELIRKLGAGRIGVVHEAYDRERDTKIALKQLRVLSPAGLIHLRREFRVLKGASHPNIIQLYDLVLDETPPFLTMELLDGEHIITHVRGPRPAAVARPGADTAKTRSRFADTVDEKRLRKALAQIAQGLHAIHEIGVVHRDLKPSNIMVTSAGRAVIMDFSIAADARSHGDEATSGGVLVGTPDYMAPEQATGSAPTPAADWYAFGVVLYESITGERPFHGTWDRIVQDKQTYDAPSVHQQVADVPEDLARLCAALLARHAHERPSSREVLFQLGVTNDDDPFSHARRLERVPFVGRVEELAALERIFADTAAGTGHCVLVTGPSGVGKTRLVSEFLDQVEARSHGEVMVFQGACHPVDQRPHNAFDDVVDQLSRVLARMPKNTLRELLPAGHELLPRMFPACSRIPGVDRVPRVRQSNLEALRARTIDVLRELFEAIARKSVIVMFVDDTQWADRDSVDLLCDLFNVKPPERVLMLLALRTSQEQDRSADDTLSGHSPARAEQHAQARAQLLTLSDRPDGRLEVGELEPAARKDFLSWMYRETRPPLDELDCGQPRLLIERARRALATKRTENDIRDVGPPVHEDTLDRIMGFQLRTVSKRERDLLEICALIGYPAPISLLARVVDIPAAHRESAVEALRMRGLVRQLHEGREPWLAVGHEAVRTAMLQRLDNERRVELYQRLATTVERSGNATNPELAASWYAARDFERAFPYLEVSAKATRDRFAFHRSEGVYQAALESVSSTGPAAERLTLARAELLARAGRSRESAALYERVGESDAMPVDVRIHAADQRLRAGDVERGTSRMLERVATLEKSGKDKRAAPGSLAARVRQFRVSWAYRRHRSRHRDEVALSDLHHVDSLFAASVSLALFEPHECQRLHSAGLFAALRHGERERVDRAMASELIYMLASHQLEPEELERRVADVERRASERNEPHALALSHLAAGLAHYSRSRLRRAEDSLSAALEMYTWNLPDAHWELAISHCLHTLCCILRGHFAVPAAIVSRTLERARRSGDIAASILYGSVPRMWCLMAEDRALVGLALLDELEAALPANRGAPLRWLIALARVMAALYTGHKGDARQSLERLEHELPARRPPPLIADQVTVLRVKLASLTDDLDALGAHARALERQGDGAAPGHAALIRARLAEQRGARAQAISALEEAHARFVELGASLHAMAARYRLAQLLGDQGDAARDLEIADSWCRAERIASKSRMFDYLCPWSAKDRSPDAA